MMTSARIYEKANESAFQLTPFRNTLCKRGSPALTSIKQVSSKATSYALSKGRNSS